MNKVKKFFKKLIIITFSVFCINQAIYFTSGVNLISLGIDKVLAILRIYTEEVKSVEMSTDLYLSEGHGHYSVKKSADWTSTSEAYVQFDVTTNMKFVDTKKDVVFILDTSGSMAGEKIEMIQDHAKMLTDKLLDDSENRIALIKFDTEAEILSRFTNDKKNIDGIIDNIELGSNTNYYDALLKLKELLRGYSRKANRDLIVMFLSDGYPNIYNPNQASQYKVLKKKYPYMVIQGIQYEMGIDVVEDIKKISDNQFVIDLDTVNNILFEAVYNQEFYEGFEVVDYIDGDYWILEDVDDIEIPFGKVKLTVEDGVQKVTWTVGPDEWRTGEKATMKMHLKLKEQYVESEGFYPTNLSESFSAKLYDEEAIVLDSELTPVLKSGYYVNYHSNVPSGCTAEDYSELQYAYKKVKVNNTHPTCEGYVFKGYEVPSKYGDSIKFVNSDVFIMPTYDVDLYGVWTKVSIAKDVSGNIVEKNTLYDHIASLSKGTDASINYLSTPAASNTMGVYQVNGSGANGKEAVYFYRGTANATHNNIVFGDYCWLIIRTTDTGGVKLLYNGVRNSIDGSCLAYDEGEKDDHVIGQTQWTTGYNSFAYQGYTYNANKAYAIASTSYTTTSRYWGSSVTYNSSTGTYTLVNTAKSAVGTAVSNGRHYTCSGSAGTSCTSVRYIAGYYNSSYGLYIILSGGDTIETAMSAMQGVGLTRENQTDSLAKETMDEWYESNDALSIRNLSYMLEDTPYCNDRSITSTGINGWKSSNKTTSAVLNFSPYERVTSGKPSNACSIQDSYTVSTDNGNGLLNYPIGLMTIDEMMYAGGVWNKDIGSSSAEMSSWYVFLDGNTSSSTNSGSTFNQITLSAGYYLGSSSVGAAQFLKLIAGTKGELSSYNLNFAGWSDLSTGYSLRPVISLKPGTMLLGGSGTTDDPYVIVT